jgi:flagella synthesis protein FlgN
MASANPIRTVADELQLMTALRSLMQEEQACLIQADGATLATLTPEKSRLTQQLMALATQRQQALGAAGCAAEEAGMEVWLERHADGAARRLWQELLELTREAKELNRLNGMLIGKQLSHNQSILNALRTPTGGGGTNFYGPSGQTSVGGPSRHFVIG